MIELGEYMLHVKNKRMLQLTVRTKPAYNKICSDLAANCNYSVVPNKRGATPIHFIPKIVPVHSHFSNTYSD